MTKITGLGTVALVVALLMPCAAIAEDVKQLDPLGGQAEMPMAAADSELQKLLAASGWVNQSGSVMNFAVGPSGQISGTYVNNAAGTGCQGSAYPLTGWVYGNNIAWSVTWTNAVASCNSVTAWGGYYDPNSNAIQTNWVLAYQTGSGGATQLGADVFKYQ
jgi:hypothetical protein